MSPTITTKADETVAEAEETVSALEFFFHPLMRTNLMIAICSWLAAAFGYYLIGFEIKYLPGSLYMNVVMSSVAEAFGKFLGNIQIKRVGIRQAFVNSFSLAILGAALIVMTNGRVESPIVLGLCLFVTKLGVAMAFLTNYLAIVVLFPTLFNGTVAGVCNFVARMGTIFAPLVAEMAPPFPMLLFIGVMMLACGLNSRLEIPTESQKRQSITKKDEVASKL